MKDGGREILELTRTLRIPVALATSTATELARTKLRLAGLLDFFAAIVGGDAVTQCETAPGAVSDGCVEARFRTESVLGDRRLR